MVRNKIPLGLIDKDSEKDTLAINDEINNKFISFFKEHKRRYPRCEDAGWYQVQINTMVSADVKSAGT